MTGFATGKSSLSFDLDIEDNLGQVTVESPLVNPHRQKELDLILNRLAKPEQVLALSEAMGNKPPKASEVFTQRFLSLKPEEQKVAMHITTLLMKKPEPTDLREQLRALMATLPDPSPPLRHGEAVGRTLNALGLFLPNLKPDSVASEDASSRIRNVYMSFNSQAPANDPQNDFVHSKILLARKENFKIVLQVSTNEDITVAKQKLMKVTGISDPAEFDKIVSFKQTERAGYNWGEDGKVLLNDNRTMLVFPNGPEVKPSISAFKDFVQADLGLKPGDPGYTAVGHHGIDLTRSEIQGNVQGIEIDNDVQSTTPEASTEQVPPKLDTGRQLAASAAMNVRETLTYNEGGNMVAGTLPNGQPYAVIGRDGVIISTFLIDSKERANPGSVPEFAADQIARRREALGLNQSVLSPTQQVELEQTLKRLQNAQPKDRQNKPLTLEDAKDFLAKMDICKDIFAKETGVPRKNLAFVSQPGFHVDMHMRPLQPGQILLNDFDKTIELLENAKKSVQPDSVEAKEIDAMLTHTRARKVQMQPIVDEIASQLKDAGLEVVRAPGVMDGRTDQALVDKESGIGKILGLDANRTFDVDSFKAAYRPMIKEKIIDYFKEHNLTLTEEELQAEIERATESAVKTLFTRQVNFMNAVPGSTSGSNTQFYATNATSIAPLREQFEAFMRSQGIERVEWMASSGGDGVGRSAAEISLSMGGGLDCREVHAQVQTSTQFA
ncbi:MAG: hypothetical protein AB7I41_20560 [Candidatus Sericytochromatia bacterium]